MEPDSLKIIKTGSSLKEPLPAHIKATREDWLNVAREILVSDGVGEVKVLTISERLDVSRSSFYWYFKSRKDLLNALLVLWEEQNTRTIIEHCSMPAGTIPERFVIFSNVSLIPICLIKGWILPFANGRGAREVCEHA